MDVHSDVALGPFVIPPHCLVLVRRQSSSVA